MTERAAAPDWPHLAYSPPNQSVIRTAEAYVGAAGGDLSAALSAAVSDLLDVQTEAERRKLALDAWVSHGYVRGLASERLASLR